MRRYFGTNAKLQTTWKQLARIILSAEEATGGAQPRAVFFYGLAAWCLGWWETIADVLFRSVGSEGLRVGIRANTVFAITNYPAAHRVGGDYFRCAGEEVSIRAGG